VASLLVFSSQTAPIQIAPPPGAAGQAAQALPPAQGRAAGPGQPSTQSSQQASVPFRLPYDYSMTPLILRSDAEAEIASLSDASIGPIPLAAGPRAYGFALNRFLAARVDAAALPKSAASPVDALLDRANRKTPDTVVVAFPLDCGDRSVKPKSIEFALPGPQT